MPYFRGRFIRPPQTDNNQAPIKEAAEIAGANVADLSGVGKGCPDLLVGALPIPVYVVRDATDAALLVRRMKARGEALAVWEVKAPLGPKGGKSGRDLRAKQEAWILRWGRRVGE